MSAQLKLVHSSPVKRELTIGCWGFYKYDDKQVPVHIPDLPKPYLLDLKDFRPLNLEK